MNSRNNNRLRRSRSPHHSHHSHHSYRVVPLLPPAPPARDWIDLGYRLVSGVAIFLCVSGVVTLIGVMVGRKLGWFR